MATPSTLDAFCRVTVVTDTISADVALPAAVPLVELLPSLIARFGDPRLSSRGAVVQRWGEEPLDENRTPAALNVVDGEMLFLRPRTEVMPPAEFDDLVDAITTTTGQTAHRWRAENTVLLFRVAAAVPLLLVAATLLLPGPSLARAVAALLATVLAGAGAVAAARSVGDEPACLVLAVAATALAGLSGALLQAGDAASSGPLSGWLFTPGAACAGGAGILALAMLQLVVLGEHLALFAPAALFGGLLGLLGLLALFTPAGLLGAAAAVLVLSLVVTVMTPMLAFRLARLQLPPLPDEVEDLDIGIDPLPGREVVAQIMLADRCVTGLLYALGASSVLTATLLVFGQGWATGVLIGLGAALQLVRTRLLRGVLQRLAILVPGIYIGALALFRLAGALPPVLTLALSVAVFLGAGAGLLVSARWIANRILPPYWGRTAEIVEWLSCAALLPVAAVVLGIYSWARGIGG